MVIRTYQDRAYAGEPTGEGIVHAAKLDITGIAMTLCRRYMESFEFFEAPSTSMVTCLQCLAVR